MSKLEKLYFRGNKFTDNAKQSINVLRKNHIQVIVKPEDEKKFEDLY